MKLHNLRQRCNPLQLIDQFKTLYHTADTTTTEARAHGAAQPRAKVQHTAMHQPLQHTATHCNTPRHNATHCYTLQHIAAHCRRNKDSSPSARCCRATGEGATHCNAVHHNAPHTKIRYGRTARRCTASGKLQHTAAHCNTLQHTATHYNTLRRQRMSLYNFANVAVCKCRSMQMSMYANVALHLCACRCTPLGSRGCKSSVAQTRIHEPITATHCNILQHTATQYRRTERRCTASDQGICKSSAAQTLIPKPIVATHFKTLQHTATRCNTLQHAATHCNTMQHNATHYGRTARRCTASGEGNCESSAAQTLIHQPIKTRAICEPAPKNMTASSILKPKKTLFQHGGVLCVVYVFMHMSRIHIYTYKYIYAYIYEYIYIHTYIYMQIYHSKWHLSRGNKNHHVITSDFCALMYVFIHTLYINIWCVDICLLYT